MHIANSAEAGGFFPKDLLPVALSDAITRYQFELSGPTYRAHHARSVGGAIAPSGQIAGGITLQMAQRYVGMTGHGEIWVRHETDGRDRPVGQIIQLKFPPEASAGEWVEAEIATTFTDRGESPHGILAYHWGTDPIGSATAMAGALLNRLATNQMQRAGFTGGMMLLILGLGALAVVNRHRKTVRVVIYSTVIASMLVVPLSQAQQVHAFYDGQAALQRELQAARTVQQTQTAAADFDPHTGPQKVAMAAVAAPAHVASTVQATASALQDISVSSSCVITATSDCDGDGLTDNVEIYEAGHRYRRRSTPTATASAMAGRWPFQWFGTTWYLDPLKADSNGDGIDDGEECFVRADVNGNTLVATDDVPCLDRDMDEDTRCLRL